MSLWSVQYRYKACKKQIQAAKFAKAIATEHTVRASETANVDAIDVPLGTLKSHPKSFPAGPGIVRGASDGGWEG